jgi:hypothetical protein
MQRYTVYLYLETTLHVSGGTSTHHKERIQLYLQHLVFVTPLLLTAVIVEELEPVWVCCGWRTPPTAHETCATAEIWEACWHVSRPELHVWSRDVSRVTEVWICTTEFNVKSPLTSQLHALTPHELTWREDSVSPALQSYCCAAWACSPAVLIFWKL